MDYLTLIGMGLSFVSGILGGVLGVKLVGKPPAPKKTYDDIYERATKDKPSKPYSPSEP